MSRNVVEKNCSERIVQLRKCVEDKESLIREQFVRISELEHEVGLLKRERDALLDNVNELRFRVEMMQVERRSEVGQVAERGRCTSSCGPGCGPGPPSKQLRSSSEDGAVGRRPTEDEGAALKRSRPPVACRQYELSQDLLDKQVEMLERKYGGMRARNAALTIQRAFRSHCMQKRFLDIASAFKGDGRRTQYLASLQPPVTSQPSPAEGAPRMTRPSPVWKNAEGSEEESVSEERKRSSRTSDQGSEDGPGYGTSDVLLLYPQPPCVGSPTDPASKVPRIVPRGRRHCENVRRGFQVCEQVRKRQYRVGLNLFNKKPERGVRYLVERGFLEPCPRAVACFLLSRKGLSKLRIGEYLGTLVAPFNMRVLQCFVQELDFSGMQVDLALRKFQSHFILPGEAQKIERLVEVFSRQYVRCNGDVVGKLHSPDTVFVLAFSVVLLNTDLHTPSVKADRRMKPDDYVRNLRGVDEGQDLDRDMLVGIYERIKAHPLKPGSDHVSQVLKVQHTIVGKRPNLALPHRRLVCYCRLYEVYDVNKKERPGVHQREVFLFNDLVLVTKIFSKKKSTVQYAFRQSLPLCGMSVALFEAPHYPHGISLSQRVDDKPLMTFNARNEHDRYKFVEDLKESILEMDEMENLRIEGELEKQQPKCGRLDAAPGTAAHPPADRLSPGLKRSALSNSLLDLHDPQGGVPPRRGSAGSLDSGMVSADDRSGTPRGGGANPVPRHSQSPSSLRRPAP